MNMLADLFKVGQSVASPMDASQIKVEAPTFGGDLVGLNEKAGESVAAGFKQDVAKDNQMGGLLSALTAGGVNALGGGGGKQEAPAPQWVRGGSYFDNPGANAISNMQMAGKLGGILNGRSN